MKKVYIAGNWKMNKTLDETISFVTELKKELASKELRKTIPVIFPPAVFIDRCNNILVDSNIYTGSQDASSHGEGAYTGEISASMLQSLGIRYCLAGHSERRKYHHETDNLVNLKAKQLLDNDIIPVICVGEQEEEREQGITEKVVLNQLEQCLNGIAVSAPFIIAYEPVWAIGTGKTATPQTAQEVHHLIRNWLTAQYGQEKAGNVSILYGGSIKVSNFAGLLQEKDIDGGLIGGASLSLESYLRLIEIGEENI